eukprot:Nk52_evm45s343 gene=Nk52_evmTU45s343
MGLAYMFAYSEISTKGKAWFSCLNSFVGGLTVCVGALQMFDDASNHISNSSDLLKPEQYPFASLLFVIGFALTFLIDHALFNSVNKTIRKENFKKKRKQLKAAMSNQSDIEKGRETVEPLSSLTLPNPFDHSSASSKQSLKKTKHEVKEEQRRAIYAAVRFALVMQIVVYCTIAGFAMGIQSNFTDAWPTLVAISCFTVLCSSSVAASLYKGRQRKAVVAAIVFMLIALTGSGYAIGYLFRMLDMEENKNVEGIFLALSAGAFVFMGGKEMQDEIHSQSSKLTLVAGFFGFVVMALLLILN